MLIWASVPVSVSIGESFPAMATAVVPAVAVNRPEIEESWTVTTDDASASTSATDIPVPCRASVTFSVAA